jgi:DNA-binding NtrC family response regulator
MPGARILIVDDEEALATLLKQFLARAGYQVEVCTQPTQALELLKTDAPSFAVLVTDLALPEINGEELIERARKLNPKLRAIVTSGYAHRARGAQVEFLQKPFSPKALVETIERMLAAPEPGG